MGSKLIGVGSGFVIVACLFDLFFRLRMFRIAGDRQAFLRTGPDWQIYSRYRAAGKLNGWATWPVNAMWAFLCLGVVVLTIGVVAIHNGSR